MRLTTIIPAGFLALTASAQAIAGGLFLAAGRWWLAAAYFAAWAVTGYMAYEFATEE